ncbi:MAG: polysaccharide deacetylase family protein [Clostridia bacterium]|nr:polysaccharide deacetylase family protein [Clostridia bacterium]
MKLIACLLSILIPFSTPALTHHCAGHGRSDPTGLRWYVRRTQDHVTPELPSEFSRLTEYDGYYADTACGENGKVVYLTFDAGYENGNVEKILDTLKEKEVPGAFFILSHFLTANPVLVERMIDEGHLVCNHTARHRNMAKSSDEEMKRELTDLETLFRERTGREISKYYRPPEGSFKWDNLAVAKELGYATVFWSFAYADWDNQRQPSPDAALKKIRDNLHSGAVILLHPTSVTNAKIMPELIDELRAQGYRFGTLDELTGRNGK